MELAKWEISAGHWDDVQAKPCSEAGMVKIMMMTQVA